jgi:hypothetical protein
MPGRKAFAFLPGFSVSKNKFFDTNTRDGPNRGGSFFSKSCCKLIFTPRAEASRAASRVTSVLAASQNLATGGIHFRLQMLNYMGGAAKGGGTQKEEAKKIKSFLPLLFGARGGT